MTNPACEATNSDVEKLKPGKYAILYRDNWDGEGDTYHTLADLDTDGRWLSDETGKELLECEGDEILKAWALADDADTLAPIAALEQSQQRIAYLEKTLRGTEETLIAATDLIAELEAAPNGMMQLSNELAEMKRKCVEMQEQKDKWATWAISLGAKADELESRPLCVKSNDAMREAAPLCVKLPDSSSKAFWSGAGKTEKFHPETYKRWVKEAIERAGTIAGIKVEVK